MSKEIFSDSVLKRVSLKAGVEQISGNAYPELRDMINDEMDEILKVALIYCNARKAKTISEDDVRNAILSVSGVNMVYASKKSDKKCKV